ncbi:DUF4105 domain-containing protein [Marinomonas agarivorans]|nr:DUF4105 domain-containing protein [Marinomonas agarivorans]
MPVIRLIVVFAIMMIAHYSHAQTNTTTLFSTYPALQELQYHPRWLKLVHYKGTGKQQESLVDDEQFFLAPTGKTSAQDELLATLSFALQQTEQGQRSRCRFPARIKFLEQNLNISLKKSSDVCPEFETWRADNNVDTAWLIFPSAYLNSPSSMFGHTLLRLDKESKSNNRGTALTANAVNYAANVDEQENGFLYAFKGLFGGYLGYFSMMPYYKKVKEYSRIENRDIWEYKLNLNAEEMEWLLLHLWELDQIRFDYYFTTQNCSYQLLALLDVVRPDGNLTNHFELIAIPIDTIRELKQHNWIERAVFRPSKATEFYDSVNALPHEQQDHVASVKSKSIADFITSIDHYDLQTQIDITNASYKLLRLDKGTKKARRKALTLLRYRSRLGKGQTDITLPVGRIKPEDGHEGSRFTVGTIANEETAGALLDYKITYHGLDDPVSGYAEGAHINFLHAQATVFDDTVKLQRFDVLDIRSLAASDQFIDRLAWQVKTGWERKVFNQQEQVLVAQLQAQFGKVYKLGKFNWYALLGGHVEHSDRYTNPYQAGPNVSTGLFHQGNHYVTEVAFKAFYYPDEDSTRQHWYWNNTWSYARNASFGIELNSTNYSDTSNQKNEAYNSLTLKTAFFF